MGLLILFGILLVDVAKLASDPPLPDPTEVSVFLSLLVDQGVEKQETIDTRAQILAGEPEQARKSNGPQYLNRSLRWIKPLRLPLFGSGTAPMPTTNTDIAAPREGRPTILTSHLSASVRSRPPDCEPNSE